MSEITSVPVAYEAGDRRYRGAFVARAGAKPTAAFVLLPDWRGQSTLAHDHARFLVDQGCVVLIADLYGDGFSPTDPSQVGEMVKRLIENREAIGHRLRRSGTREGSVVITVASSWVISPSGISPPGSAA